MKSPSTARARLQDAALKLFASRGYANVSVRDLMNECGLTAGALYAHYKSKEGVLADILKSGFGDWILRLEHAFNSTKNPADRLVRLVYAHAMNGLDHIELGRIARTEMQEFPKELQELIIGQNQIGAKLIISTLDDGVASGVFEILYPRPVMLAIFAGANQLPFWFRNGGRISKEMMSRWHAELALKSVATGPTYAQAHTIVSRALNQFDPTANVPTNKTSNGKTEMPLVRKRGERGRSGRARVRSIA